MSDLYTDRDYFDRMFASIDDNFLEINNRLDKLNGNVAKHEKLINENLPHNIAHCSQAESIDAIQKDLEDYHFVKKYPKLILMAVAILVIGLIISSVGTVTTISNSLKSTEIQRRVKDINYMVAPERSYNRDTTNVK